MTPKKLKQTLTFLLEKKSIKCNELISNAFGNALGIKALNDEIKAEVMLSII